MMTLEESIEHCKDVALSCTNKECALEHFQLLKWLQEYRSILEKQGEQKSIDKIEPKFKVGDTIINIHYRWDGKSRIREITDGKYIFDEGSYIDIEEQDSWELVGKNKPKFSKGEWITNGEDVWQINEVKTENYLLIDSEGNLFAEEIARIDSEFHLWDIADAKDGDVLCCKSGWTCIFKDLDNHTNTFSSYCFMDSDNWFCNTDSECHTLNEQFIKAYNCEPHPATKEQRDTLMKAIIDAGYKWDSEKKELRKIEQKPIDNIESKFKVGDWVVENGVNRNPVQITSFEEDKGVGIKVWFSNGTGTYIEFLKGYHLWTIKDANDGDVLATNSNIIFIYKYLDEGGTIAFRASCTKNSGVYFPKLKEQLCDQDVYPATKEQRDLLFSKMHEAGYEWDADKKEPKKIEDTPTLPFDSEPLTEFERAFQGMCSEKNRPFAKDCCKVLLELARKQIKEEIDHKKQNEDDNTLKAIIYTVKNSGYKHCIGVSNEEMLAWLEKQGEQKLAWSEEDEIVQKAFINLLEMYYGDCINKTEKNRMIAWLKSLKQRLGGGE